MIWVMWVSLLLGFFLYLWMLVWEWIEWDRHEEQRRQSQKEDRG